MAFNRWLLIAFRKIFSGLLIIVKPKLNTTAPPPLLSIKILTSFRHPGFIRHGVRLKLEQQTFLRSNMSLGGLRKLNIYSLRKN